MGVHQGLIARPGGVPEKVGVNKEGANQKWYSHQTENFNKQQQQQQKNSQSALHRK